MFKLIAFAVISVCLISISWRSLRVPRSHGFYRFFAWEFIVALFLLNVDACSGTRFRCTNWFHGSC
jgi:hypothetical protein